MANCMLGFPNRIDQAALSGGSWVAGLPLSMLQDRIVWKVARSSDTALASTQLLIDLGKNEKIQALALRNHNLSLAAKYRVTASLSPTFATVAHDSGWRDVWPVVYPYGTLEWEDENWWGGKYTNEETEGYVTELDHLLPELRLARYWRIEIDDRLNHAGFVQIGRVMICPVWQPKINMIYGASIGWETKTEVQEAMSGSEYFQVRVPYRVQRFDLDWMDQDVAFSKAFELVRRAGIDKEVLFIHDPDDTVHALRRRFMARLRTLGAIEYPLYNLNKTGFELKEQI
jgi:hypothetical protein